MTTAAAIPRIDDAECLYDQSAVAAALDRMAGEIDSALAGGSGLGLAVLQGGIVPAGQLLPRLRSPLRLDSVRLTRYHNTTQGGALRWQMWPETPLAGERIVLLDDILDEGHTLAAVAERCRAAGAAEVLSAVLVEKRHQRKNPAAKADIVGLEVDDRYVFGYGMDYLGWHRNAPGIFAMETV